MNDEERISEDDGRKTCNECQHLRAGRCMQARRAGLSPFASIEIGRDLAEMPKRCPAFKGKQ
jgi:hypothetical protein